MAVRISELDELSVDLSQLDELPIVDLSAGDTKKVTVANLLNVGISGAPSSFIDLGKLNQSSTTKLGAVALDNTGVASGTYGGAATVAQFVVNAQGLITSASGVAIAIAASSVTDLATVATSGTYASLSGLPTLGTLSSQDAGSVVISGGTISGVTFISGNVTISGGTISGITDLALADGGTGASTASGARTNLGLAIGNDVQAYSAVLSGVADSFTAADEIVYASASGIVSSTPFTSLARSLVSGSTASGVRATLGLGTVAVQDAGSVSISGGTVSGIVLVTGNATISGGTISGITDIAVADGGTGASSAADARTNLGLVIGTDIQPYSAVLSGIATQFDQSDEIVYASASGVVAGTPFTSFARSIVSGSTASGVRSTLGLGTMAVQDAGSIALSGGTISGVTFIGGNVTISGGTISGITDLAIDDGGTGASTAADARTNLGLVIGTNVQAYSAVLSGVAGAYDTTDNLAYSSASGIIATTTLTSFGRTLISQTAASGVRTELALGSMALQDAGSIVISGGTISGITDLAIEDGGTGASSAADARTNLGLVIGTDVQAYDAGLASIAGLTTSADEILYLTGADTYASSPLPSYARDFLASGNSDSDARTVLGLGALATKALVEPGDIDTGAVSGATVASGSLISDNYGAGSVLEAAIGASAVTTSKIVDSGITAIKLADNSASIVGTGAPITAGTFIGQQYLDGVTDFAYTWDGDSWERHSAISSIDFVDSTPIAFAVTYPDNYSATITTTVEDQTAATVFAGPVSGIATAPTFRALASSDLPLAAAGTVGAVQPGAGLAVDGLGAINHANSAIAGTYAGAVTIDSEGHVVTAQATLSADDIPDLDASKITSGSFSDFFLAPNSVTASQLADNGIAQVSTTVPETPEFAGQWWINPDDRAAYIWVGTVSAGGNNGYWLNLGYGSPTQLNVRFGGTYNASSNVVESINSYGIEAGLAVNVALSSPNTSNNGVYLIVTTAGSGTTPAPSGALSLGNWVLSQGIGDRWTTIDLGLIGESVSDSDVLVNGAGLNPAASGIANQEDFNEEVWARVQIANTITAGLVKASTEIVVASGTGVMSIGTVDDGSY
jgi:hypothetical protein